MRDFSLMTWNSFGAAQGVLSFLRWRGVPDAHRFEHAIVREMAAKIDVFCMQEIYLSEAEEFFDALDHAHKVRDDNATSLRPLAFGGSGLGLASRLPIASHARRAFTPPHSGSERFARKGMLHARIRRGDADAFVDVVTTHLQSGYDVHSRSIRKRQLRELRELVDHVAHANAPMIVCGDLNIDGLTSARALEYREIESTLGDFVDLGKEADLVTYDPHDNTLTRRHYPTEPRQRIDYVLVRDPSRCFDVASVTRALDAPVDDTFASDHYALHARFTLR